LNKPQINKQFVGYYRVPKGTCCLHHLYEGNRLHTGRLLFAFEDTKRHNPKENLTLHFGIFLVMVWSVTAFSRKSYIVHVRKQPVYV